MITCNNSQYPVAAIMKWQYISLAVLGRGTPGAQPPRIPDHTVLVISMNCTVYRLHPGSCIHMPGGLDLGLSYEIQLILQGGTYEICLAVAMRIL